ncbi:uncharacterized protein [Euwallacea fornicatus]|uniref:uncharacterized protein n=1 Tax=Euwallacea fornicatus TaxID=995702 RepID=UPI00338EBF9B
MKSSEIADILGTTEMGKKMQESQDSVCIGIDLGTTYTAAAIYRKNYSELIPNYYSSGDRLTPSVVFYEPSDQSVVVGKLAIEEGIKCRRNCLYDMKRLIGRAYEDVYVQNFITKQKHLKKGLVLVKDQDTGYPHIKLEQKIMNDNDNTKRKTFVTPEDVATEILKSIKEDAKRFLACNNIEAVISVPAYFSYAQRAATERSAKRAGLIVMGLITEPVAAAVSYTYGKIQKDTLILVVDLGGGTLDVSLIKCGNNIFEVKSIDGDMFLGGSDLDDVVYEHLKEEIEKKFGQIDETTKKGERLLHRINSDARKFKEWLSTKKSYKKVFEYNGSDDYEITLNRSHFEQMIENSISRVIQKVDKCLTNSNVSKKDVDRIILAGGSTRIPKLQEELRAYFDGKELNMDLNPDEAVALGASIHAALLKKKINVLEVYEIRDMAPHSLGILAKYDLMVSFIKKGTHLPICIKQVMETSENDQKSVVFSIFEGERIHCINNKKLGQFIISNLPLGKAGQVEFEVTFFLDESGLLRVSAVEMISQNSNQLEIKMGELSVCDSLIFTSAQMESIIDERDKQYEQFCKLRLIVDTYISGLIYDIDQLTFKQNKHEIIKVLHKFNRFYSSCQDLDLLKLEFEKLQNNINSLISIQ